MNIVPSTPPKLKASSRKLITWLRKRTCGLVYGVRTGDRVVPSSATLTELRDRVNRNRGLPRLRNADYEAHFRNEATYYFWAGHRTDQAEVVFEIDIDVLKAQGRGTTEGAWTFARHLQQRFAGLYCEPSTGGKGVHGIGVLKKGTLGPGHVRTLLRRFEQWLRDEKDRVNADIELVEVTGLPPVCHWHRSDLSFVNPGVWAKIPRDSSRAAEIMGTYRFGVRELSLLELSSNLEPEELPTCDDYVSPFDREVAEILSQLPKTPPVLKPNEALATALEESFNGIQPACRDLVSVLEEIENGAIAPDVQAEALAASPHKSKKRRATHTPSPRSK